MLPTWSCVFAATVLVRLVYCTNTLSALIVGNPSIVAVNAPCDNSNATALPFTRKPNAAFDSVTPAVTVTNSVMETSRVTETA